MVMGSFDEAWQCKSTGKCIFMSIMEDYIKVMSDRVVKTLVEGSVLRTMILLNHKKNELTAAAHTVPLESLVTLMTGINDWYFIDPTVAKKYIPISMTKNVPTTDTMVQDNDEILKYGLRYLCELKLVRLCTSLNGGFILVIML